MNSILKTNKAKTSKNAKTLMHALLTLSIFSVNSTNAMEKGFVSEKNLENNKKNPCLIGDINIKTISDSHRISWNPTDKYIALENMIISLETGKATYKISDENFDGIHPSIKFVPKQNLVAFFSYHRNEKEIRKFDSKTGKPTGQDRNSIFRINNFLGSYSIDGKTSGKIFLRHISDNLTNIKIEEFNIDFAKNTFLAETPIEIQKNYQIMDFEYIPKYNYLPIKYWDNDSNKYKLKIINIKNKEELVGEKVELKLEGILFLVPEKNVLAILENITEKILEETENGGFSTKNKTIGCNLKILKLEEKIYTIINEIKIPHGVGVFDINHAEQLIAILNEETNNIEIVDINSGVMLQKLEGHKFPVVAIKFGNNGRLTASMDNKDNLKIWQHNLKKPLKNKAMRRFRDTKIKFNEEFQDTKIKFNED
jgi:hypothetical protein